jgi:hypothetical protein
VIAGGAPLVGPAEEVVDRPRVDEDVRRREGDEPTLTPDQRRVAQQAPQAVERDLERPLRLVSLGVRPHEVGDLRRGDLAAAERAEDLQELERPALRLAGGAHRAAANLELEWTAQAQPDRPRPGLERGGRSEVSDGAGAQEGLDRLDLDAGLERGLAQATEGGRPGDEIDEDGQAGLPRQAEGRGQVARASAGSASWAATR